MVVSGILMDIQKLVERCILGDRPAWEEFIKRFSGLLYFSAAARLKRNSFVFNKQDIEDIVQGIFVEILEKGRLSEVRDRKKIKAWLSIMAQTRALNYMRKKKERLLYKEEFYRFDNIEADLAPQLEEEIAKKVESLIEGLGVRDKLILKLDMIHGKKHKEIARFMNIPINTVSTIIARRKKALKERLKDLDKK